MKLTIEIPDTLIPQVQSSCDVKYWADTQFDGLGRVQLREREGDGGNPGPWITIAPEAAARAFALMASAAPRQFANAITGNADMFTGDVLMQLVVCGRIKYG